MNNRQYLRRHIQRWYQRTYGHLICASRGQAYENDRHWGSPPNDDQILLVTVPWSKFIVRIYILRVLRFTLNLAKPSCDTFFFFLHRHRIQPLPYTWVILRPKDRHVQIKLKVDRSWCILLLKTKTNTLNPPPPTHVHNPETNLFRSPINFSFIIIGN